MSENIFQFEKLFNNLERGVSDFFEGVAENFVGKADNLRDGTEFQPVDLPRDLYAHENAQTEWWYYTGHCETVSGKKFGFEFVFFKRRTDLDKFSLIPVRLLGNPIYFAHFALTDVNNKNFRYAHRKSANGAFDLPANFSESTYFLKLGDWSIRQAENSHILHAELDDKTVFQANLKPIKPVVFNGKDGKGVSFKDEGEASRYFAYTRMQVEGDLVLDGKVEHFTGSAWMDREFGTWTPTENQKGWDWFSVQLENDCELMCYQLRDSNNAVSPFSSGTFVDKDGNFTHLTHEDFIIEPLEYWKSEKTQATYPIKWRLKVEKFNLDLLVIPVLKNQELDTRGTTMIVYWEGACEVKNQANEKLGNAYVEMVGYDRSHDNPNLAYFLMGNSFVN
ncbi:MAG: hypothetical protein MUC29_04620 [Pyrinomonadaceae bacterium]|jgi:predicted secreted hydrolase|nr:hypothetical protein [Pyrinomonadaceae bacterium]